MSRPKGRIVPPTLKEVLKENKQSLVSEFNGNRQTVAILVTKLKELELKQAEIQGKLQLIEKLEKVK